MNIEEYRPRTRLQSFGAISRYREEHQQFILKVLLDDDQGLATDPNRSLRRQRPRNLYFEETITFLMLTSEASVALMPEAKTSKPA
jgi:hypothetical protein